MENEPHAQSAEEEVLMEVETTAQLMDHLLANGDLDADESDIETLHELIARADLFGLIEDERLNSVAINLGLTPEQIEELYLSLERNGIEVVKTTEKGSEPEYETSMDPL